MLTDPDVIQLSLGSFFVYLFNVITLSLMIRLITQLFRRHTLFSFKSSSPLSSSCWDKFTAPYYSLATLPGRVAWLKQLEAKVIRLNREKAEVGLLLLDIDRFKGINSSLGHEQGDALLLAFANRIKVCAPENAYLARLGDDEFGLLLPHLDHFGLNHLVERILVEMEAPFILKKQRLVISTSIGGLLVSERYSKPTEVLHCLSVALTRAKSRGKGCYEVFEPGTVCELAQKFELEVELRQALVQGQFQLYFQPKVELATGVVREVEALLRWNHPLRGFISPDEFIPVAEETGLICQIGQWVLEDACRKLQTWNSRVDQRLPLVVSINLSPVQFQQVDFITKIAGTLAKYKVNPKWVQFEITESSMIKEMEKTSAALHELKGLGVKLALDDFGTGYCSLHYLKYFPFDTIKIDRTFISGLHQQKENKVIVRAIVNLSQNLGMVTVAEGVETQEEVEAVKELNCELGQGYYFSRPIDANALATMLNL